MLILIPNNSHGAGGVLTDAAVNLLSSTLVFLQIIQARLRVVFVRTKQLLQDWLGWTVNYPEITQVRGGGGQYWSVLADNYFQLNSKRETLQVQDSIYVGLWGVSAICRLAGSGNQDQRVEGEYLHVGDARDVRGSSVSLTSRAAWCHHVWREREREREREDSSPGVAGDYRGGAGRQQQMLDWRRQRDLAIDFV